MNELEKQLLREEVGEAEPRISVASHTRLDTGRWWWPTRAWVCVVNDELVMLTVSRRRYVARVPLDACGGTYYCPATGELVIQADETLMYRRFRMSPRNAMDLLKAMGLPQWEAGMTGKQPVS